MSRWSWRMSAHSSPAFFFLAHFLFGQPISQHSLLWVATPSKKMGMVPVFGSLVRPSLVASNVSLLLLLSKVGVRVSGWYWLSPDHTAVTLL